MSRLPSRIRKINGTDDLYTSIRLTDDGAAPLRVKRIRPKGGVIPPTVMLIRKISQNTTGSKWSVSMTGV